MRKFGTWIPRWKLRIDGDPRGYVCAIYAPHADTDSDEPFIRIPAEGYRASQMHRMTARS